VESDRLEHREVDGKNNIKINLQEIEYENLDDLSVLSNNDNSNDGVSVYV
jgi:hypothetical protein